MEKPKRPLRLLSLDGGGVRGLSSIMILKHLMTRLNKNRSDSERLEPWQIFDMIGGTSTGGIIAIMLGRLRMSLGDCELAYLDLSKEIFTPRHGNSWFRGKTFLQANGRFDSKVLEDAIKRYIGKSGLDEDVLLKDEDPLCKVFVVAVRENITEAAIMRSYENPETAEFLYEECKVWEACRATSAATTFFDPIEIGRKLQRFVDGAILYNNPVRLVLREAQDIWPDRDALLISVGTGEAPGSAFRGNILNIVKAMQSIVTETEKTANDFFHSHKDMVDDDLYFRFNVVHGLASIGLEEYSRVSAIADTTEAYLDRGETRRKVQASVERLTGIKSEGKKYPPNPLAVRGQLLLEAAPALSHDFYDFSESAYELRRHEKAPVHVDSRSGK